MRPLPAFLALLLLCLVSALLPTLLPALVNAQAGPPIDSARDLSGVWLQSDPGPSFGSVPPMTPWGAARFAEHRPTVGPAAALDANDPTVACAPPGVPYVLLVPVPIEFVVLPGRVLQLFEYNHNVRIIHTDGRPHPPDLRETDAAPWMGHAIGRWDGDTFEIDTVGFNDQTWLDRLGHPHSADLHVVERIRRSAPDQLEYTVTVHDPVAYTAPWTGRLIFARRTGWELLEHHCVPEGDEYRRYRDRAWQTP